MYRRVYTTRVFVMNKKRWKREALEHFEQLFCSDTVTELDASLFGPGLVNEIENRHAFSLPMTENKHLNRIRINRIKMLGFEWFGSLQFWAHRDTRPNS